MQKIILLVVVFFSAGLLRSQENIPFLLASGLEDTRHFAQDYIRPGVEGAMYNLSNGWYQSAEVKGVLGFEFSIIGNASINLEEYHTFVLNTEEYQNIQFLDGANQKEVATILGPNDVNTEVLLNYESSSGTQQTSFILPQGIGSSGVNFIPTVFLQGRLGVFKGTEIKIRYFPTINYEDVEAQIYGGALQHEFTSWLPAFNFFPVAISGLVGYTRMQGEYDFTEQQWVEGSNQRLTSQIDSWLFSAIASTKLPVINFYGGIGYIKGSSETKMLGIYSVVDKETGENILSIENPLSLLHNINGYKANLGLSLKLGLFKIHADYNFQVYQTISVGIHVGL